MDRCTENLRIEICAFLPLPDLYLSVIYLNHQWYSTFLSSAFLKELLRVHIGLTSPTALSLEDLRLILIANSPDSRRSKRPLPITGFAVTGGDDMTDLPEWQPAYLFNKDSSGYSSASNHGNVICAGFLSAVDASLTSHILSQAKNCMERGLLPCSRTEMVQEIPMTSMERSKVLACVHGLRISRRGAFSCPLQTFVLLTSLSKVSLSSNEFEPFFALKTMDDVFESLRSSVISVTVNHKFQTVQFRPRDEELTPVVWGKFIKRRCVTIVIDLKARYLGRCFYLLMLNAENRMREMGDFHSEPNIDIRLVEVQGRLISLF